MQVSAVCSQLANNPKSQNHLIKPLFLALPPTPALWVDPAERLWINRFVPTAHALICGLLANMQYPGDTIIGRGIVIRVFTARC